MTRSRRRKIARDRLRQRLRAGTPVTAVLLAAMHGDYAAAQSEGLDEVVVTAQKRLENLQDVPISVQVFDNRTIEQLGIVSLYDYVKYSPSVSFLQFGAGGGANGQPGSSLVYIRGVVSGGDGNQSGSQPSVGMYLDEIPVTTVDGQMDIHIYDLQRIEVLEGPQGTLFGASSESGTVRLITNKPDATKFSAGYDVKGDYAVSHTRGYELEGFVNIPISDQIAVRLVGWLERDPGTISNVAGTNPNGCIVDGVRTFPSWAGKPAGNWSASSGLGTVAPCPAPTSIGAGSITNAPWTSKDYNKVITRGGRGAVKFDLGSHWTVTPSVVAQEQTTKGFFGYDPAVGDLALAHFGPESSTDSFYLAALTVEGKIFDFDVVDAGGFFKRQTHSIAEYSDYAVFYDRVYGSGAYWTDNTGKPIAPRNFAIFNEYYEKWSNEFRVSTPADKPLKATVGFFIQRQLQNIWKQYTLPGYNYTTIYGGALGQPSPNPNGLSQNLSIPNLENTLWLTDEQRVDREQAEFAQVQWDITPQWSVQGGIRFYRYDNSLDGFYGYNSTYSSHTGVAKCFLPRINPDAPCTNLNTEVSNSGSTPKVTLTFTATPEALVYATFSKGYRPGGVNRVAGPNGLPYAADYLQNYELGWKTEWLGHRLRWNGALFWENWDNFQFAFLVPPSLTVVANGGNAVIKGLENTLEWAATDHLMVRTNFTILDPYLTQNYCGTVGVTNCPNQVNNYAFQFPGAVKTPGGEYEWIGPLAPKGTNLPVTPKFKGNIVTRYTLGLIGDWSPYAQAAYVYQSQTSPMLAVPTAKILGTQPAYGLLDLSVGAKHEKFRLEFSVTNVTDKRAQLYRFAETNPAADNQVYVLPAQPRTIALTFAQRF
jgi:outer membrane receptor protein involved in Fe transport